MIDVNAVRRDHSLAMSARSRTMPRPFKRLPNVDEAAFSRMVESIEPQWIEAALVATGTASVRHRRLPAEQVLWLVLGMALYRPEPIHQLVERLALVLPKDGSGRIARSSVIQARDRLGDEPMEWLFKRCASEWAHTSARKHAWRDLALYAVDGTTLRTPDSPENRAHFGGQGAGEIHGASGYPLVRVATLMALRTHVLAGAAFGPYVSEHVYASKLWELVPDGSLMLVDRGFFDAKVLIPLARDGKDRHWLTRARTSNVWTVIKAFTKNGLLVEFKVSKEARRADPTLPETWIVRAIRYQRPGFAPQFLLTSLLDRVKYPAKEVVALYHERWEIELGYDEVKTELLDRQETLRSKTPRGIAQELWAVGLVYNLVRLEMERIAEEAEVPPTRISFKVALKLIRDEWMWLSASDTPGTIPRQLRELRERIARYVLPPRREGRTFPRAVKIKMSNYDRKRPILPKTPAAK